MKLRFPPRALILFVLIDQTVAMSAVADPASPLEPTWKSGSHHLTVDGRDRTFLLDVPRGLQAGAPLVLFFHGFTGSALNIGETTGFAAVAEKDGFVVAYPDAENTVGSVASFLEIHWTTGNPSQQ